MMIARSALAVAALLTAAAPLAGQRPAPARGAAEVGVATGHGWYGFAYYAEPARPGSEEPLELVVQEVVPGSPAFAGGLRSGDRIIAVDGRPISSRRLEALQERVRPGETLRVRYRRGERRGEIRMVAETPRPGLVVLGNGRAIAVRPDTVFRVMEVIMDSVNTAIGRMQIRVDSVRGTALARGAVSGRLSIVDEEGRRQILTELVQAQSLTQEERARALAELAQLRSAQMAESARLHGAFGEHPADTAHVRRLWELRSARVPLQARVTPAPGSWVFFGGSAVAGARFEEIGPAFRGAFGVDRGLLVLEVAPGTPAERAGLRPSDVIIGAAGESVSTLAELRQRLSAAGRDGLPIEVVRDKKRHALRLPR